MAGLQERGIPTVVNYRAIHLLTYSHEHLGFKAGAFPMAERIGDVAVSLPLYPGIPAEHVAAAADGLRARLSGAR